MRINKEQIIPRMTQFFLLVFLAYIFIRGFFQVEAPGRFDVLAVSGVFCFWPFFFYGMKKVFQSLPDFLLKKIFAAQCIVIIIIQLFFLFYYKSMYLWDTAFVVGGANSILEEGKVAGEAYYYLSVYPNQNGFVLLTMALLKLGAYVGLGSGSLTLLLNTVNLLAIDISLVFTLLIVRKINKRILPYQWNLLLLFLGCNPFLYVTVSYYYTMTLSMPWFMGFVYFFISLVEKKADTGRKWIGRAVAAGVCFAVGYYLRATTIIPFIAAVVCSIWLLWCHRKKLSERTLFVCLKKGCVLVLAAMVLVSILTMSGKKIIGIDTKDTAFPAAHWLMMSLSGEGFHNEEDEAYTAGFLTKEEKSRAVMERLKERMDKLGLRGFIRQAGKKIEHTFAGGAGSYKMFYENALATDKGYSYVLGEKSLGFLIYAQAYHLFTIFLIMFGFRKKSSWDIFFLQMTLLGAFLFYVLWEAAAQYQIPFLLIMSLLAADGGKKGMELIETKNSGKIVLWTGFVGAFLTGAFLLNHYTHFTREETEVSHPVVTQILANEPVAVNGSFQQGFQTDSPFNYMLFQWRNPIGEENDSAYQITLTGSKSGNIFTEMLSSEKTSYQGGFEKQFDMVVPDEREYFTLSIEKVQGSSENYLEFVTYYMGGYDSYPLGNCTLEEGRDLTFLVSKKEMAPPVTPKKYIAFCTGFFLLFLFLVFCCKIRSNVKRKDLSYGS